MMPRLNERNARFWQLVLLVVLLVAWHVASRNQQIAFFLGEPIQVAGRIWSWFLPFEVPPNLLFPEGLKGNADIYRHLGTTLLETVLAFGIGTVLGLACGLWLALAPTASLILDPYIKAANSMPRVILAPIFALWFGLGIWSKVALAVTLVFFIVFFNVYQGVREVSPVVLANAKMLGANQRQLLRTVYLPSATKAKPTEVCRLENTQLVALGKYTVRRSCRWLAPSILALASTTGLTSRTPW